MSRTVRGARELAQSLGIRAGWDDRLPDAPESDSTTNRDRIRVLRWVFVRGNDRLVCQLALSNDDACYELRTMSTVPGAEPLIECFVDAAAAFDQQSHIERTLVTSGWTLDSYESLLTERPASMLM